MAVIVTASVFLLVSLISLLSLTSIPHNSLFLAHGRSAVSADVPICSQIGLSMLRNGGNAVDAAVAATVCVGTINMFSSGLGGGGFMLIRLPNSSTVSVNFRESAPSKVNPEFYAKNPESLIIGPLSVAVPGEIAGLAVAHTKFGRLNWSDLFAPSIILARDGFPASSLLHQRILIANSYFNLSSHPDWSPLLAPNGSVLAPGDTVYRKNLAHTLTEISRNGAAEFYTGKIARSIVDFMEKKGGIISLQDLAAYTPIVEQPLTGTFRGRTILTCPPPCSGPALIEALNILDGFPPESTATALHRLVESMKWLAAGRTELGDPIDEKTANRIRVQEIMSQSWAEQVRKNISDSRTFSLGHYHPSYQLTHHHGTTHLNVVDNQGMAVSLTSTINLPFGSLLHDPNTGIVFNNELDDFSLPGHPNAFGLHPSPYNLLTPFKRPLSSSVPTIVVRNNSPELVLGASGGSRIITAVLEAIVKFYDWNLSLQDMVTSPRVHHQLLPMHIQAEDHIHPAHVTALEERGHKVILYPKSSPLSDVQAIHRLESGLLLAISDPRKHGRAAAE